MLHSFGGRAIFLLFYSCFSFTGGQWQVSHKNDKIVTKPLYYVFGFLALYQSILAFFYLLVKCCVKDVDKNSLTYMLHKQLTIQKEKLKKVKEKQKEKSENKDDKKDKDEENKKDDKEEEKKQSIEEENEEEE